MSSPGVQSSSPAATAGGLVVPANRPIPLPEQVWESEGGLLRRKAEYLGSPAGRVPALDPSAERR